MSNHVKGRIDDALVKAKQASQIEGAYSYLPAIINALGEMRNGVHADSNSRWKIAGALGRLVTEDYTFSEGPLGQALLKLADEFAA
jgi:hypothetical protein